MTEPNRPSLGELLGQAHIAHAFLDAAVAMVKEVDGLIQTSLEELKGNIVKISRPHDFGLVGTVVEVHFDERVVDGLVVYDHRIQLITDIGEHTSVLVEPGIEVQVVDPEN